MEIGQNVEWNDTLEILLKSEAEKALCLRWAHNYAHKHCARMYSRLALPVIVLGTLSGSASLGGESLMPWAGAGVIIGFTTLVVSMLNVVQAHFGFSRRAEGHRVASLSYGRLNKFLTIELSLPRAQRVAAGALLKFMREEIDRLNETAPVLPDTAIAAFKTTHAAAAVAKPDDLNGLDPVNLLAHTEAAVEPKRPIVIVHEPAKTVSPGRGGAQASRVSI